MWGKGTRPTQSRGWRFQCIGKWPRRRIKSRPVETELNLTESRTATNQWTSPHHRVPIKSRQGHKPRGEEHARSVGCGRNQNSSTQFFNSSLSLTSPISVCRTGLRFACQSQRFFFIEKLSSEGPFGVAGRRLRNTMMAV